MVYTWTWNAISFPSQRHSYFNLYYAVFSHSIFGWIKKSNILCCWFLFLTLVLESVDFYIYIAISIFSTLHFPTLFLPFFYTYIHMYTYTLQTDFQSRILGTVMSLTQALYKWRNGHFLIAWCSHNDSPNLVWKQWLSTYYCLFIYLFLKAWADIAERYCVCLYSRTHQEFCHWLWLLHGKIPIEHRER